MDSTSEVASTCAACEPEQRHHDDAMRLVRARLRGDDPEAVYGEIWERDCGHSGDLAIALADMVIHYARFYVDYTGLQADGTIWSESPEYNPDDFDAVVGSRLEDYAMFQRAGHLKRWR